jgi:hypothetical protein
MSLSQNTAKSVTFVTFWLLENWHLRHYKIPVESVSFVAFTNETRGVETEIIEILKKPFWAWW